MHPTDPQNDIKGTGNFEFGTDRFDFIIPPPEQETTHDGEQYDTPNQPPQAEDWMYLIRFYQIFQTLPEVCVSTAQMANALATSPLSASAFYRMHIISACHRGIHALLNPPVRDLATEIQEL